MRFAIAFLLLGVVGLFILAYTIQQLPPFDWEKLDHDLELQQITSQSGTRERVEELYTRGVLVEFLYPQGAAAFLIGLALSILSFFAAIHLALDKLFFKRFYEQPSLFPAVRRGVLLALFICGLFIFAAYNLFLIRILVLYVIAFIFVEVLFAGGKSSR